ncbi:BtpA family membrane complex biogenesis protein [bacterium 1XD8-76]|nr:BtpA family membrane complex biogenesis protein [bacterium 1XD8-76]
MLEKLGREKVVIGCIHLLPMPNTPFYVEGGYEASMEKAVKDARALYNGGASGCIIQNVDRVFVPTDDTDYAHVACMAVIGNEVRRATGKDFKIGVQIMWNCITPSLAACKACGADYTRCSALVGRSDSPFGEIVGQPMKVMQYKKSLDMPGLDMIAEISGYHFLNKDGYNKEQLIQQAKNVLKVGAAAVEMSHPDEAVNNQMVADLKEAIPGIKIVLGGHTNVKNVSSRLRLADGAIVGSCFENGNWGGMVCEETVAAYMNEVQKL